MEFDADTGVGGNSHKDEIIRLHDAVLDRVVPITPRTRTAVMVRKTAYLWILSPLALLWPASAVAVGQDVTSGSPVAISYAGDMPPAGDAKVPAAPDAKAPTAPMADAAAPAAAAAPATAAAGDSSDCCKLTFPEQTIT